LDHGLTFGPPEGMTDVPGTVERLIAGKPDELVIGPGVFEKTSHLFAHRGAPAVIIRTDSFLNHPYLAIHGEACQTLVTPTEAAAMGAGARGEIYGRNAWQAGDPVAVSRELRQIIHVAVVAAAL
jgi:DhnA family fructose-bisphosphate aldolase class Ia